MNAKYVKDFLFEFGNTRIQTTNISNKSNTFVRHFTKFLIGKDLFNFIEKIKQIISFDDYILKVKQGSLNSGGNQFIINIYKESDNVGFFHAGFYKNRKIDKMSLQIKKVVIYPKYRGKGIMRNFYIEFNKWLKQNFENFNNITSDFVFLYNKNKNQYDAYIMWEDLVSRGLAKRLGPDKNYIPPKEPEDGMYWYLKTGYTLI